VNRPGLLLLAAALGAFPGCAPRDGATRYALSGKIVGVDILDRQLLIAHDEVKGYMPAMTMPLRMPESTGFWAGLTGMKLERLKRGDVITATLAVKATESWIENVRVVRYEPPEDMKPPPPKESKVGAPVVDTALVDQDGRAFKLSDYRGHPLALTFIYTRCPLPEFCPRIMKGFQQLDEAIEKDPGLRKDARLLSVSFDVEFDRPEVLRAFGSAFVKDRGLGPFARWRLATGTEDAIARLGRFLGLVFFKDGSEFAHSMVTIVVGRDGNLVQEFPGNDWLTDDVLKALQQGAAKAP